MDLQRRGWTHIGDPDSIDGYVLDAFQTSSGARVKLFTITTPTGVRVDYVHRLAPTEMVNNSFAAIAPGGRWFVSGEWLTMSRLLVFALPRLPPANSPARDLPLVATIRLNHPVRNVQGCSFQTATTLLCTTSDPRTDLYPTPDQLLSIRLDHPLTGAPVAATVTSLGQLPQRGLCRGNGEPEGLDVSGSQLLITIIEPGKCAAATLLYTYTNHAYPTNTRALITKISPPGN